MIRGRSPEKAQKLTAAIIEELGFNSATVSELHKVSFDKLVNVSEEVLAKLNREFAGDVTRMADALGFGPIVDGKVLPNHPFDPLHLRSPSMFR